MCQNISKGLNIWLNRIVSHYDATLNYPFNLSDDKRFQRQIQKFTWLLVKLSSYYWGDSVFLCNQGPDLDNIKQKIILIKQ